jgi:hypothetical protein
MMTSQKAGVMTDRTTARLVGVLFIIATMAGMLSLAFQLPIIDAHDHLIRTSVDEGRVATGALFELIMAVSVVGIAIAIHPVLARFSERLALGYVVSRTVEGMVFLTDTVALLTLLTLSRDLAEAGPAGVSLLQTMGGAIQAARDWGGHGVLDAAVFSLSALILNYVLYRARLVPRMLSVWGLVGAASYMAAGVMVLYGLEPLSTVQVVLDVPLGIQELALAGWLIVKGFDAPPAEQPPTGLGPTVQKSRTLHG